ncbi:hypothetical protein CHUAL_008388 [Chamberlinius hualienensis]
MVFNSLEILVDNRKMKFDDILAEIGECGLYQKLLVALLYLPCAFIAMQNVGYTFTGAIPNYRCFVGECDNDTTTYEEDFLNSTTPYDYHYNRFSQCQLFTAENGSIPQFDICPNYKVNWTSTYNCDNWKYDASDYISTVVTQFNLVCDHDNLAALSQSIYMIGNMFGGLLAGMIADRYGRKKIVIIYLLLCLIFGVTSAFAQNFPLYLVLRFFLGGFTQGSYLILFVMSVEFVGKSYRVITGMLVNVMFSIGEMVFGGFAYAIRDWRFLQVTISAPYVLFLLYFWAIPDSPRWMLSNGKVKEAEKILTKFAKSNGKTLTKEMLGDFQPDESSNSSATEVENLTWIDLFRTPQLRMITIIMGIIWFMVTMAFYGITMSAPLMGGNQFTNFIIVSAVETPAYLFGMVGMEKFGRRYVLFFSMILGGVAGVCTPFVPDSPEYSWLSITLATIGKFGASAAFGVIFLFTTELYPTGIRNNGIAFSSFTGHLGSVISPYIAQLVRYVHYT